MHSKKTVLIVDLMNAANMELIRLDFRSSALSRHDKEFRRFCNYCTENGIQTYDAETGPRYFRSRFGLNIGDANIKLNRQQLDARNSIRFLDDIFQFGCRGVEGILGKDSGKICRRIHFSKLKFSQQKRKVRE